MSLVRGLWRGMLVGVAALGFSSFSLAAEFTLRLHSFEPPQGTSLSQTIVPWAKRIEAASNGRVRIKIFPAMQLGGKPPELYNQVKDGVVDIAWTVLGYTPGLFTKTEVFELPFMTTDATSASKALWEYVQDNAMDEFRDVHLLGLHTHGPGLLHTDRPIRSAADLKGLKVRGGSRVVGDLLQKFGATPVGMPITSVGEALSKGVIQGTAIPYEVTPVFKVHQMVKYHTEMAQGAALYTMPFGFFMNQQTWQSLPPDLQEVFNANSALGLAEQFGQAMDAGDVRAKQLIQRAGNDVSVLSPEETKRWAQVGEQLKADWVQKAAAEGFDGAALIKKAQALIAKHRSAP